MAGDVEDATDKLLMSIADLEHRNRELEGLVERLERNLQELHDWLSYKRQFAPSRGDCADLLAAIAEVRKGAGQ